MKDNVRDHIVELLGQGFRLDGRKLDEYRKPLSIETGVTKTAEGSARVVLGETEVIVGVKVELGTPYPDIPDQGTMMVGAELLPLSNPDFELGPPGIEAIELSRVVDRGIRESKAIDFKKLCVKKGELSWMLIIDICSINDAGNLLDASSLGALAALRNMKFPKIDGEKVDYQTKTDKGLEITDTPIAVTVIKIGEHFLVDPTIEEQASIDARLTVTTLSDGTLCAMQKGGEVPLMEEDIVKMVDLATKKGKELRKLFK